ncbi:Zn-dependent protease with chaperone function [Streptomyces sp. TLI_55]|uniref:M48 family metalloprotease n=1 Tax=Streptomyces sp. TLI_55 TaxID=1938861 RepID=UPI000BCB1776|nr:M48 family metalloprotease [Streptomyces sp. TLI_55]SNX66338.1 Zn-dependent protease with chaperone function [Streptomyces sp. TLI_55]
MSPADPGRSVPPAPGSASRPTRLWGPPPWLWLTLGLFAGQVPLLVDWLAWTASWTGTEHGRDPALLTALALTVVQLLPVVFLLAGALSVAPPQPRTWWVERHYKLQPPDHEPDGTPHVYDQMRRFLTRQAPGIELRVTVRRDLLARVYPGGWRTTRVGVFSPLVSLWQRDREAAEAVLLHEIGHLRYGEQHVTGLGSPFTGLVRAWPYVFTVFGLLPVALLLASGNAAAPLLSAQIVLVVLAVPKTLLVVVGALWTAELTADRYAAAAAVPTAQQRALNALAQSTHDALARLYHPPVRMRLWFAARAEQPVTQLLLVLLWPAAMLTENLLDLCGAELAYRLLDDTTAADATRKAVSLAREQLASGPTWWATLGTLAAWPLLTGVWARLWGWRGRPVGTFSPALYATSALLPVLILLLGLLPDGPKPGAPSLADSRAAAPPAGTPPTPCLSPSKPAAPIRPDGLPSFTTPPAADTTASPSPADNRMRSFHTLRVTSTEPLSGSLTQAQDLADRLAHVGWTLSPDGTLTATGADLPELRTTVVHDGTRLLRGERTRTTDVSATTTWVEARLRRQTGRTVRLDLIRAATGVTHAVVACRAFDSTVTTAARLTLQLEEQ